MGMFVGLPVVFRILGVLNARFAEGDPITEMAALQEEFEVFSESHDLRDSLALIGMAPIEGPERTQWLDFLDHLKTYASNNAMLNGHDWIRQAFVGNLEDSSPKPMFFQYHLASEEPRVMITTSMPIVFSTSAYIVVSVPTQNGGKAGRAAVKQAPSSKERRGARSSGQSKAAPAK